MKDGQLVEFAKATDCQKRQAVEVFLEGFGHMMTFTKNAEKLRALFLKAFHPSYMLLYVENQQVLGVLGMATNNVRPIKFDKKQCKELFGRVKGSMICAQMNAIFQSQAVEKDTDLYLDVIATAKEARGRGIATKLIEHCFQLSDYQDYYIEVLSKNTNAKRLYEHLGFVGYKHSRFSPIALNGLGYPIKMKKE
ncbi:hypothetical protein NRIC_10870 [Enterococcus florum]|uniref:N-acetyltransferase domain-containing protein n=1 Tax=Enterococcus florum TaxID=2480627 RepID=A0A4P5P6Z3_9ENTE|nr:GNAT family N-acetyltransferase [Enterococcus florum]GCF93196.1 hypothetical protein NRIC_10870 [Enterococcus florum]